MEDVLLRLLDRLIERVGRLLDRASPTSRWFVSLWFGAWAAGTAFAVVSAMFDPFAVGTLLVTGVLALAGGLSGFLLRRRVARALAGGLWRLALVGVLVAFLALETAAAGVLTAFFLAEPDIEMVAFMLLLLVVLPVFCLPLLLSAGPLSGLGLGWVARYLVRRRRLRSRDEHAPGRRHRRSTTGAGG